MGYTSAVRRRAARTMAGLAVLALAGCGSGATKTATVHHPASTAASIPATAASQVKAWCAVVYKAATESSQGEALHTKAQADQLLYDSGQVTYATLEAELQGAVDDLGKAIHDTKAFMADPPPPIAATFTQALAIPGTTVSVSQERTLAADKATIKAYLAKACNVDYNPSIWWGDESAPDPTATSTTVAATAVTVPPPATTLPCPTGKVTGSEVSLTPPTVGSAYNVTVRITNGTNAPVSLTGWEVISSDGSGGNSASWAPPALAAGASLTDTGLYMTGGSAPPSPSAQTVMVFWNWSSADFGLCAKPT